jgi:hypothetical protein
MSVNKMWKETVEETVLTYFRVFQSAVMVELLTEVAKF